MGDFANGYINRIVAILLSVIVIGINIFFVTTQVNNASLSAFWIVLIGKEFFLVSSAINTF